MRYKRPLYLMIKLRPQQRAALVALCAGLGIELTYSPDRWHCTLLLLGESTPAAIEAIRQALHGLDAEPVPVAFDWVKDTTLKPARGLRGVNALQKGLRRRIAQSGFQLPPYKFGLHLNLEYKNVTSRRLGIGAIVWCVDEILLIESVNGEARHIEHGSWQLKRRQGAFEFAFAA